MSNEPNSEPQSLELTVLPPTAIESLTRGEIDCQISVARKFPRSLQRFQANAKGMVTIDQEVAESCIYSRPVGMENGQMKYAEGMSIRMAEIVSACYGNIRSGAILVEQTERKVTARGFCHDLETNTFVAWEVTELTVKKNGQPYGEAQRNVVAKATLAKAQRDAIFKVVPKALCRPIELDARRMITGNAASFDTKKANVVVWISRLGIDQARVWNALGITGPGDLKGEHLLTLHGLKTSIKDGDVKIDEAFPSLAPTPAAGSVTEAVQKEQAAAAPPPEPEKPAEAKKADPSLPSAESLRKSLYAKAQAELNLTKKTLPVKLVECGYLAEGVTIESLDADALLALLDSFVEFSDKVKNPGGEA